MSQQLPPPSTTTATPTTPRQQFNFDQDFAYSSSNPYAQQPPQQHQSLQQQQQEYYQQDPLTNTSDTPLDDSQLQGDLNDSNYYCNQQFPTDPSLITPITSIGYDRFEELLWIGNANGKITSYTNSANNGLERYTSWLSHKSPKKAYLNVDSYSDPMRNDPTKDFVRELLFLDPGVVSLGAREVQMRHRRGLVKWTYRPAITPSTPRRYLTSITPSPNSPTELIVASSDMTSSYLETLNVYRGTCTKSIPIEPISTTTKVATSTSAKGTPTETVETIIKLKTCTTRRYLACATSNGKLELRDPRTFRREHAILAHTGTITDFDISGNTIVTCGVSINAKYGQTTHIVDPMIQVYDLRRMNKPLFPILVPAGPSAVKFHPKLSSTIFITASTQNGFCTADINNPNVWESSDYISQASNVIPLDSETGYVTCFDVSESGDFLAFGDSSGVIHQWMDYQETPEDNLTKKFNTYSRVSEGWTDMDTSVIGTAGEINDQNVPLNVIGMPYYTDPLFSHFPSYLTHRAGLPPPTKIPADILANVRTVDSVGYALNPNPALYKRNSVYVLSERMSELDNVHVPKFRSEQEREQGYSTSSTGGKKFSERPPLPAGSAPGRPTSALSHTESEDELADWVPGQPQQLGLMKTVPKYYRKMEIKYSRFGVEDFDFGYFNKTPYAGLETHIKNSYLNPLLQLLFSITPLRLLCMNHVHSACYTINCLTCELGFLFKMLEAAGKHSGSTCQATNFLRAFNGIPQGGALGLFEPASATNATTAQASIIYGPLIQTCNRFLLERMHQEVTSSHSIGKSPASTALARYMHPSFQKLQQQEQLQQERKSHCQILPLAVSGSADASTGSTVDVNQSKSKQKPTSPTTTSTSTSAPSPLSTIQQIFGMYSSSRSRCSCSTENLRESIISCIDLSYPRVTIFNANKRVGPDTSKKETSEDGSSSPLTPSSSSSPSPLKQKETFASILQLSIQKETWTKAWCASCKKYAPLTQKKYLSKNLAWVLNLNVNIVTDEDAAFWGLNVGAIVGGGKKGSAGSSSGSASGSSDALNASGSGNAGGSGLAGSINVQSERGYFLPLKIAIVLDPLGETTVIELDGMDDSTIQNIIKSQNKDAVVAVYELSATIAEIHHEKDPRHLVAHIKLPDNPSQSNSSKRWFLFNDFLVQPIAESDVVASPKWRIPAVVQYKRVDMDEVFDPTVFSNVVDLNSLLRDITVMNQRKDLQITSRPFSPNELPLKPNSLVAIDAEFVSINKEETEIRSDGTKSMIRPSQLSLARVSVLRGFGEGSLMGLPFIDDYIAITEPVMDYLTEFSGIKPDDLNPETSKHTLVPLKAAYKKLRLLVDMNCIFIGHGLKKDFRIINIFVPPEQVIDTVDIYHIKNRQRKISLKFLAWYLLKEEIQLEAHDSIEDARMALLLYQKSLDLKARGIFDKVLEDIYKEGRNLNWKPVAERPVTLLDKLTAEGK